MCDSVSHGSADCPSAPSSASSPQLAVQLLRGRSTRLGLRTYVQTSILRGPACTTRGANSGTCSWSKFTLVRYLVTARSSREARLSGAFRVAARFGTRHPFTSKLMALSRCIPLCPTLFPAHISLHLNAAPLASERMPSVFFRTMISRSVSCREYSNQRPQQSRRPSGRF